MDEKLRSRVEQSLRIRCKYPGKVPVIVRLCETEKQLKPLKKNKFLINESSTLLKLIHILRKRMQLPQHHSIYLFTEDGSILSVSSYMNLVYDMYSSDDGFLYLFIRSEETFG